MLVYTGIKIVPDPFSTNKIPEKVDTVVFSNDDGGLNDIDSDIVTLYSDGKCLNNIKADDENFDKKGLHTNIVLIRLIALCNRFKQHKEIIHKAQYPTRMWIGVREEIKSCGMI